MKTILQKLFRIPVKIVSTISWSFLLSSLEIFVFEVHLSIRDLNWQFPREAPFQIFITPGRTRYWWNPRQLFEKKNGWAYSIRGQDPNNITDTGARCLIYVWNPDEKGTLLEIWNININWSHSPIRNEDGGSEWLWQMYDFGGQVPGVK